MNNSISYSTFFNTSQCQKLCSLGLQRWKLDLNYGCFLLTYKLNDQKLEKSHAIVCSAYIFKENCTNIQKWLFLPFQRIKEEQLLCYVYRKRFSQGQSQNKNHSWEWFATWSFLCFERSESMWDKFNKQIPEVFYSISEETFQNARSGILLHWNANCFEMFCLIIMKVAELQLNHWLVISLPKEKKRYLECLKADIRNC